MFEGTAYVIAPVCLKWSKHKDYMTLKFYPPLSATSVGGDGGGDDNDDEGNTACLSFCSDIISPFFVILRNRQPFLQPLTLPRKMQPSGSAPSPDGALVHPPGEALQ